MHPFKHVREFLMRRAIPCFAVALILFCNSSVLAYTSEDCIRCHSEGSTESRLHLSIEKYNVSVHAEQITCLGCHASIQDEKHVSKGPGIVNCNRCHDQRNNHGLASIDEPRPKCHSCHTKHSILEKANPYSSTNPKLLKETCRKCHPAESGEIGYLSWFSSLQVSSHGKQDIGGAYMRDNCIGCHRGLAVHGDEEAYDDQGCYRCHNPRGETHLWGNIHPKASLKEQPGVFAAAIVYQLALVFLLLSGLRFVIGKIARIGKGR